MLVCGVDEADVATMPRQRYFDTLGIGLLFYQYSGDANAMYQYFRKRSAASLLYAFIIISSKNAN
jgi:hypothetical protein